MAMAKTSSKHAPKSAAGKPKAYRGAEQRYHQPLRTLAARIADGVERRHGASEPEFWID